MSQSAASPLPPTFGVTPALMALRPSAMVRTMMRQPLAVWALYSYLFFEYVRPQTIYPAIDLLPWAQISLLTAAGAALVYDTGKRRWTIIDSAMTVYTLVVLASLITAFDPQKGWDDLDLYLSWVIVYFVISTIANTPSRLLLMFVGWFLWNLKMSQHAFRSWAMAGFAFRNWGVTGAPGWFQNSGEFGIEMCVVVPISLYFALGIRRYVSKPVFAAVLALPFTGIIGAIGSSSRGALLGLAAGGVWMFLNSRYKVKGGIVIGLFLFLGYLFTPEEQRARLSESGEDDTSLSRLTYWERGLEFANDHPVLGIGYRSWLPYYSYVWGSRLEEGQRVQLPHNFAMEALAELGYVGLCALLFLLTAHFLLNGRTRRLARRLGEHGDFYRQLALGLDGGLIGFMVSGFFVTVLYYPFLWVNLGMTVALHLTVGRVGRAQAGTLPPVAPPVRRAGTGWRPVPAGGGGTP